MRPVYVIAENIVSPVAQTAEENFVLLQKGITGIKLHDNKHISPEPFYASLFDADTIFEGAGDAYTKFEQLLIMSVSDALRIANIPVADRRTALIISSTKGNISLIEEDPLSDALRKRIALSTSARLVAGHFGFATKPLVVSQACISGIVALITGLRMLQSGNYDHIVVAGADIITRFILSGFQSFHAVSAEPCKPFDAGRNGITLGEGAATIVLSAHRPATGEVIKLCGGSVSNDANHISGPSRTGAELYQAIKRAIEEAGISQNEIDIISAHGTATLYNDEMESKAINLAGLQQAPVNSLKGFYGHTLGAAGLIESVIFIQSLKKNMMLPTPGFKEAGTTMPVNVSNTLRTGNYHYCLKTASGFGGCNAAVVLQKAV